MTKFSPNPLRWFSKRQWPKTSSASGSPALLRAPAMPRKSGNIFMHLINIQKSLKSMELAMRQQIDFSWLNQKITVQMAVVKREAETVKEEELAAVAGQVEAYFETVFEGRLDLDEEGLAVVLEFTNIFKDIFGDAVSATSSVDLERLDSWNTCYQSLMAKMRPSCEDAPLEAPAIEDAEPEPSEKPAADFKEARPIFELSDDAEDTEPAPLRQAAEEAPDVAETPDLGREEAVAEEQIPSGFETSSDFAGASFEDNVDAADDIAGVESPEEIPLYDPNEELRVRDDVISDAEIKSAREYMDVGKSKPKVRQTKQAGRAAKIEPPARGRAGRKRGKAEQSPVQLQEVERLKAKLTELHEKQEMLSSKMTNILGDYKKAVRTEAGRQDSPPTEDLGIKELEDIIFIGREKG